MLTLNLKEKLGLAVAMAEDGSGGCVDVAGAGRDEAAATERYALLQNKSFGGGHFIFLEAGEAPARERAALLQNKALEAVISYF